MKQLALPLLLVLAACGESPLASIRRPDLQSAAAQKSSSITTVTARPQVVSLEFIPGGPTIEATFKARFSASTDPAAQMDGAILVVSAADGPMPVIGGESLAIEITRAVIDASAMIHFEGIATVSSGRVVLETYAVTGSTQAAAGGRGDDIIWDILGGNNAWEVRFSAITRIIG
jgi:hypothetical protein